MSHEQYVILNEIAAFFGKNEYDLMNSFDFLTMIRFNILWGNKQLFNDPTIEETEEYKQLFAAVKDSPWRFNSKYMNTRRLPGGVIVGSPRGVCAIATSSKYCAAVAKSTAYEGAVLVPTEVKQAIHAFMQTIHENESLLFDVLNEKAAQNPQLFKWDSDVKNPLCGNIYNEYRARFKKLQPCAEEITRAIRITLRIK